MLALRIGHSYARAHVRWCFNMQMVSTTHGPAGTYYFLGDSHDCIHGTAATMLATAKIHYRCHHTIASNVFPGGPKDRR